MTKDETVTMRHDGHAPGSVPRGELVVAVLLLLVGLHLRLHDVASQLMGGDELHALTAAEDRPLHELLSYHTRAQNSIPLTIYARLLMDLGAFSELTFRMPALLAGLLLPLTPLLFRRSLGIGTALIATALLTVWPMCLYYSFVARPYGPAALFLVLALHGWHRWTSDGSRTYLFAFSVFAALACYFHVLCLFPVLWLLLAALLEARRGTVQPAEALRAIAATAALGALLIGPGLPGLIEMRLIDSARPEIGTPALASRAFAVLAGTEPANALVLFASACAGCTLIHRSSSTLGRAITGILISLPIELLVTQPFPTTRAWARYEFLVWPVFVIATAVAIEAGIAKLVSGGTRRALVSAAVGTGMLGVWWIADPVTEGLPKRLVPWLFVPPLLALGVEGLLLRRWRAWIGAPPSSSSSRRPPTSGAVGLAALFLAGGFLLFSPVAILYSGRDDFRGRRESLHSRYAETVQRYQERVSPFFRETAALSSAGDALAIWPLPYQWREWGQLAVDQRVHGKRVYGASPLADNLLQNGMNLENFVDLDDPGWHAARGIRYLVVDLDLAESSVSGATRRLALRRFRRRYGRPAYRDGRIVVYKVQDRQSYVPSYPSTCCARTPSPHRATRTTVPHGG